ncbi:MAG TPA: FadR/GntR family transcriptional regulator [Thermoleophilaceae bacterium]|nr:FadR/GntR family transcriptional regulator [Thermoleophilaceae bacterium]
MSAARAERGGTRARRSISEDVADRIRLYIQQRDLGPGDRIGREEDLAREFGVSRPTLREALRLLSSEHLIRASKGPGGGIFVAATPEHGIGMTVSATVASMIEAERVEFDELIETRLLFEVPLAGLAAQRATDEVVAKLKALVKESAAEPDNRARMQAADAEIHRLIALTAGNRLAAAFSEWIVDVLHPLLGEAIAPAVVEPVVIEQHEDLVKAIARGDPAAAERAMREHLVYLRDLVSAVESMEGHRP